MCAHLMSFKNDSPLHRKRERERNSIFAKQQHDFMGFICDHTEKAFWEKNEKNKTTKTETETKGRDAELNFDECGGRLKG